MFAYSKKKQIPILMYHSISQHATPRFEPFIVSPALFAEHMMYLQQKAYTPITVSQFISTRAQGASSLPMRPVVLTFDDSFADFFTEALPVLKKHGFVATLYVATSFINSTSQWLKKEGETTRLMLTWDQLKEISEYGVECGAHSHYHRQLDILPYSVAQDEIVRSKNLLEQHLGKKVLSFAYPFGYNTAMLRKQVREAGYTSACAVKYTMSSEATDPFALARLMVKSDTDEDMLATLLAGRSSLTVTNIYPRIRTSLWQLARRLSASTTRYLQERLLAQ